MTAATAATAATASTAATAASRSWRLQDALAAAAPERVGRVSSVVGLGLDVHGLDAAIGDSVRIGDAAPVHAEVVAADAGRLRCMPFGVTTGIGAGAPARRSRGPCRR